MYRDERFRAAFAYATVGMAITDLSGKFVHANPAYCSLVGYTEEELLGMDLRSITFTDDLPSTGEQLDQLLSGQIPNYVLEKRYVKKTGEIVWAKISASLLRDADGTGTHVVGLAEDITERVQSEAEKERLHKTLEAERARFATVFNKAPALITVLRGPNHIFEMANPAFYNFAGNRKLIGRSAREAFPEIEGQGFFELLDQVYQTGEPFVGTNMPAILERSPDDIQGETFVDFVFQPLTDEDGAVSGIFIHAVDQTERRRAERALQESEERLRLAMEAGEIGAWDWDILNNRISWSDRVYKLHGVEPGGFGGRVEDFTKFIHPDDLPGVSAAIRACLNEGEPYDVVFRVPQPSGRINWIATTGLVIRNEEGMPIRMLGATTDVTERKENEQSIQALNERLKRAMTETHHRVKNNLQVISALVDVQAGEAGEMISTDTLLRVGQHVKALATIHDLLTAEAKRSGDAEFLHMREALDQLWPLLQTIVSKRNLTFSVDDIRLPVRQGTSLVVLINELISNSVKHGAGDIDIQLAKNETHGLLTVTDKGSGFPEDFNPSQAANTGLELIESLAKWDLRGSVAFENNATGGAKVKVTFPLNW